MKSKFWSNFFREDLGLKAKWWHRLFLIIFLCLFIWALFATYDELIDNSPYFPQWTEVEPVGNRLTPEIKRLSQLKRVEEGIAEKGSWYYLNIPDLSLDIDNIYCSADLVNKITEVQNKTGIYTLYTPGFGLVRSNMPVSIFTEYIQKEGIKCLTTDYITQNEGVVRFLRGTSPSYTELSFYEKSNFLTALFAIKIFSITVAIFAGIVFLYYKVFLYVVFGSTNNNKK